MSAVTTRVSNDLRNRIVAVLRENREVRNIGALADQLEAAIRAAGPVAYLRHGEETPVQNVPFGAMWISDKNDPRAFPVYDCPRQPAPSAGALSTAKAEAIFTEYFAKNYPGPDTVIFDPKWHAPKIFRAVVSALSASTTDTDGWHDEEKLTPDEAWTILCETPDITSPEDYPDHALITFEQLRSYMHRASAVPKRWQLVPEDATNEMVRAAIKVDWSSEDEEGAAHNIWHAMIAAAPTKQKRGANG